MFHGAFNYCLLCHCRHLSLQIDGIITTQAEIHSAVCPPLPPSLHNSVSQIFSCVSRRSPWRCLRPVPVQQGWPQLGTALPGPGAVSDPPVLELVLLAPRHGASAGGLGRWVGDLGGPETPVRTPQCTGRAGHKPPSAHRPLILGQGMQEGMQAPCTTHPRRRPALHPPARQHITPKQAPSPSSHSHGCVPPPSLPCKPPERDSQRVRESPKPSVGSTGAQE